MMSMHDCEDATIRQRSDVCILLFGWQMPLVRHCGTRSLVRRGTSDVRRSQCTDMHTVGHSIRYGRASLGLYEHRWEVKVE